MLQIWQDRLHWGTKPCAGWAGEKIFTGEPAAGLIITSIKNLDNKLRCGLNFL